MIEFLPIGVPESRTFQLVYDLPVCDQCDYVTRFDVSSDYLYDASATLSDTGFDRIAYLWVLKDGTYGKRFAWVSMDPFTHDIEKISVPTETEFQQWLGKVTVASDHPNVTADFSSDNGNIEF